MKLPKALACTKPRRLMNNIWGALSGIAVCASDKSEINQQAYLAISPLWVTPKPIFTTFSTSSDFADTIKCAKFGVDRSRDFEWAGGKSGHLLCLTGISLGNTVHRANSLARDVMHVTRLAAW
jgi:hypothetical protein